MPPRSSSEALDITLHSLHTLIAYIHFANVRSQTKYDYGEPERA